MTPATGSEAPPPATNAVPAAKVSVQQPPPGTTYRGKPQRSRILRFMGWPTYKGTMELAPTRKTAAYMALAISPVFFYLYDRRAAAEILEAHKERVRHLAEVQLPDAPAAPEPGTSSSHSRATSRTDDAELEFPRKVWIMTTCVPDDMEADRGNRWFKTYVKPVLHAAGYDYSFLNGTVPGALARRVRDRIRLERIASMAPQPSLHPGEAGYLEMLDKRRHAKGMGLTVIVGRNTLKEYLWGMKQGWCTDFDAVQEEKGDEAKIQDLREELDRDGTFTEDSRPEALRTVEQDVSLHGDEEPPLSRTPTDPAEPPASPYTPSRSGLSFFSRATSSYEATRPPPSDTPTQDTTPRSLVIPAVSEIPAQPPLLVLPFDHPLGYLRYWPWKMFKYLFFERYRVQAGCDAALSIIQAVHPASPHAPPHLSSSYSDGSDDAWRGLRPIQPPRVLEQVNTDERELEQVRTIDEVVTENGKKPLPAWRGDALPVSGSQDLDFDSGAEWHYRKTFSETPVNLLSQRREFYRTLPEKLQVARELARGDRLPTAEEGKYPPPTEEDLRAERINKERKWRADFQGWLMTRRGGKVTWDPRFDSFRVLDLARAREQRQKPGGFVADQWKDPHGPSSGSTGLSEFV